MKKTIKRIIACVVFCILISVMVLRVGDIVLDKTYNRYYILDHEINSSDVNHEVQVYGACHSYTSFHAKYFEEKYGYSAYDYGNPGEIIPVTYLRMLEHFKTDVPKVALVEIWGMNVHETYLTTESILESYMPVNLELLPFSLEKVEVINDFYSVDLLLENFPLAKYKDRLLNAELKEYDFDYSYERMGPYTSEYYKTEMDMRIENNGFGEMPIYLLSTAGHLYTPYRDISDYYEQQATVADDDKLPFEEDMMKYLEKIVKLCEEYDVELIFYRAPYISTENELRKANWFADYCQENNLTFYDLEKEIDFDITTDFLDYYHLNKFGGMKVCDYLAQKIEPLMK